MIESAFVFDDKGVVIHWHLPLGRTSGHIPDSRDLWMILWDHRNLLGGIAHVHPWNGEPLPSQTDVTTFRAVEQGLGKLLLWPVVTFDQIGYWVWNPVSGNYTPVGTQYLTIKLEGIEKLRELSR